MPEIRNALVPLAQIVPHPRNYRAHPAKQLAALDQSLERFSQYRSVVLWERPDGSYMQVAGHGLLASMQARGEIVVRADILPVETPEADIDAILVADNQLAALAEDDETALAALLEEQQAAGFDLAALGSSEEGLAALLEQLAEPYFAPATEEEQGALDHKKTVTCPHCGAEFEPD